jgi:hypothetical protein
VIAIKKCRAVADKMPQRRGDNMKQLTTTQKRYVRELMKLNTDIRSFEDIGAEGMLALDLLNEISKQIDFEIYLEMINDFIILVLTEVK